MKYFTYFKSKIIKIKLFQNYIFRKRKQIINKKYINSMKYKKLMMKFYTNFDGLNSAELKTRNFYFRHFLINDLLGAWRWLGVFENKEIISNYVFSKKLKGIDFGGSRGPISMEISICDRLSEDIFGRKVRYNLINEVKDNSLDYIWSSHTLEHLEDINGIINQFYKKLKKEGVLLLHLPAYSCKRWRSGEHKYADKDGDSSHKHTFFLSVEKKRE